MFPLRLIHQEPTIPFMRFYRWTLGLSAVVVVLSLSLFAARGLDLGIDFRGGILLEVGYEQAPDVIMLRDELNALRLGRSNIQTFGNDETILIRVQRQEGNDEAQLNAIDQIKTMLGNGVDYRRTEFVGPAIGSELVAKAQAAVLYALLAILLYIWFRFDGIYFASAAIIALVHDIIATIGLFSLLQLEFNLATIAALLTIAGYSINDTVVVYDRIRENLRRYRTSPMETILNRSINGTLARTVMTSLTTLLALLALFFFGGEVLRGFIFAMMWGVLIGTWSSIFVAAPLLQLFGLHPRDIQS